MRIARKIAAAIGILFVLLVLAAVVLFGFIQSPPGKRMLASIASHLASSDGLTVSIEDITGFVPTNMQIGRIGLADATGPFGEIDNVALTWSPMALLSGTVNVEALTAERIALSRRPVLPATAETETASSGGIPAIRVRLGKLDIARIEIGEAVAGMAATVSVTASARLVDPAEGLALDFALTRLDAPGEIQGRARYAPDGGKDIVDLDVTASEPEGGLVARLAGIEGLPALSLTVKGSAPLDDWNGTLALDAGAAGRLDGTGAVRAVDGGRRVMLDLKGDVGRLVPGTVAPLFAGETTLLTSAVIGENGVAKIEGLNLSSAGFGVALVGTVDPAANTADLALDVVGGAAAHFASLVPDVTWKDWRLHATVKGQLGQPSVDAQLAALGLAGKGYGADKLDVTIRTEPKDGGLAVTATGQADGLSSDEKEVAAALGTHADFDVTAALGPQGPTVTAANIKLAPLELAFSGRAGVDAVEGALRLARLDLAAFSGLAGRPLSGTAMLDGSIDTGEHFSAISLKLDGSAHDVATGIALADSFLKGETRIDGAVSRQADGSIRVSDLKIGATGLDVAVNGAIELQSADLTARLSLADLARLDPRVQGSAAAELRFSGGLDALGVTGTIDVPSATAMDKRIENLRLSVDLSDLTKAPAGSIRLDGQVAGRPATGGARFASEAADMRIDDLDLNLGGVRATGQVSLAGGIANGRIKIAASDLADLSPLILTQIAGRLDADVVLDAPNGVQRIAAKGTARNIAVAGNRLDQADIDARIVDPAGAPVMDGRVTLSGLVAGGERIESATLVAKSTGPATDLTLDTALRGATIAAKANIAPAAGGDVRIRLDQMRVARAGATVTLAAPANITIAKGRVAIDSLRLASGSGGATISGRVGDELDLNADIRGLPLSLAALASPGLDLRGTLSGTARISGRATAPTGNYDLRISGLSNPAIVQQGAGPFDIAARGALANGAATIDATIDGRNLSGLTVRGSVPLGAGAMNVRVAGAIDLAIANTALATSGSTTRGRAAIDATIGGTAAAPSVSGTVRVSGASFTDSVNGVSLTNIEAVLTGTDRAIQVSRLTANTPDGGSLSGSGQIALDAARGFPASIDIRLTRAALLSSTLIRMVTDGHITIKGPVATRPRIGGRLDISRLDINIPDQMPGGLDPLQVRHINTGGKKTVADTSLRAKAEARAQASSRRREPAFVADLDLTLAAPNGVFVRGMGINAEFGGNLRLTGTTASPVTLGGFDLRRGRFDILGRRLDFTEGKIGFNGSTDPTLNFTASTTTSDVVASIIVTGTASKPEISFSSTPALAQDEVLSRILFGKSIGTLNASQALQVAQAVAQFSGGGPGVLDNVRRSLGVDSLDVDATGQVGIGKRLNDRVYVGARQGPSANSGKVTVDVDVTRNIRLQGAVGADGSGELGVGAQWDY